MMYPMLTKPAFVDSESFYSSQEPRRIETVEAELKSVKKELADVKEELGQEQARTRSYRSIAIRWIKYAEKIKASL